MRHFGIRALKWPFESKDVDAIITALERHQDTLTAALTIDQAAQVLDISQMLVLSKLPIAKDAAFDSHTHEHDERCHPKTRVALRQEIQRWAEDPQGECIFWLNGMAGTGKSTISRTVAQSFADEGILSASFFFKRGERDRGNAARLFTTIAAQLAAKVPVLTTYVGAAITADPAVTSKVLKEQFEKLILEPLGNLKDRPGCMRKIVLVIDALDECERDNDIKVIIYLLSQAKTLSSVQLRAFVTSRPDLPIRLGFNDIKGKYQDLVLHEIPKPVIEHDINAYLEDELTKIRNEYNKTVVDERQLICDWPGQTIVETLARMAIPLFIFAATVCRFVRDRRCGGPDQQLAKILRYQTKSQQSKLNATYLPVLEQQVVGLTGSEKQELINDFRTVVGSIVLLAEPLSASFLSVLLGIPKAIIDARLDLLHSVLRIPSYSDSPVRLFHLSFRDFLVDPEERDTNPFWINEKATHESIATRCLELLSSSDHLRKDICDLKMPGTPRADIEPAIVEACLPAHIRYACLYWVYHLEQSSTGITDNHSAYLFLKRHFLHWLEALSLLGKLSESIAMINILRALVAATNSADASAFLHDATRFILNFRSIIDLSPLQVYASAIVFAPRSIIRNLFKDCIPEWISLLPKVDLKWNACLQTLEGHSGWVHSVAISADGKTLASGSDDGTIKLWDTATGEATQTLEGHSSVHSVAISADGKTLTSGSDDGTIKLWDTATGEATQAFKGHSSVRSITISADGKTLASGLDDGTIKLWDTATGQCRQTFNVGKTFTLSFDTIGSCLYTDIGTIVLHHPSLSITPPAFSQSPQQPVFRGYGISSDDIWIMWNSEKLLWLPPDCRPMRSAVMGSIVALGCSSGRVLIFSFSVSPFG